MADLKITELPAATTPLAGTELLEIVQGGVNKKVATSEVGGGGAVDSVNGQTGVVVLDAGDVGAFSSDEARATRTVTGADAAVQTDDNSLIIFNSATPFNFTLDQLTASSKISYINIGAGAVTFVNGSGVTQSGDTVLSGASGNTFPTGLTFYHTATTPRNVLSQGPSLTLDTVDVSGGTITLDLINQVQKLFLGSASFATPKTIALSNAANGLVINFKFNLSDVAAVLTFPTSFTMQSTDLRWSDGAHTFTPAATGVHEFSATFDGTDWDMKATNPYS